MGQKSTKYGCCKNKIKSNGHTKKKNMKTFSIDISMNEYIIQYNKKDSNQIIYLVHFLNPSLPNYCKVHSSNLLRMAQHDLYSLLTVHDVNGRIIEFQEFNIHFATKKYILDKLYIECMNTLNNRIYMMN